jgi:hypothetical protein
MIKLWIASAAVIALLGFATGAFSGDTPNERRAGVGSSGAGRR